MTSQSNVRSDHDGYGDVELIDTVVETDDEGHPAEIGTVDPDPGVPRWRRLARVVGFYVLPAVVIVLGAGTGYLKWLSGSAATVRDVENEALQAASDSTVALLSYRADTVDEDLGAVRDRLTGQFRDSYTKLANDVVIPGAKEKKISTVATVAATAPVSVSAGGTHAVVLQFVNQTTTIGNDPPTMSASSVRVTLDRIDGRWLISEFTPV